MKQYKFVPIGKEEGVLQVALADPLNEYVFEALEVFSDTPMEIYLSSEKDITEAIEQYFGSNWKYTSREDK